jgi:hypothetical protein
MIIPTRLPPALDPEHTLANQRRNLMLDQLLPPLGVEARPKPADPSARLGAITLRARGLALAPGIHLRAEMQYEEGDLHRIGPADGKTRTPWQR